LHKDPLRNLRDEGRKDSEGEKKGISGGGFRKESFRGRGGGEAAVAMKNKPGQAAGQGRGEGEKGEKGECKIWRGNRQQRAQVKRHLSHKQRKRREERGNVNLGSWEKEGKERKPGGEVTTETTPLKRKTCQPGPADGKAKKAQRAQVRLGLKKKKKKKTQRRE